MREYRPDKSAAGITPPPYESEHHKRDFQVVGMDVDVGDYDAFIFDLDGVITDTTPSHYRAWKQTFDSVLQSINGDDFIAFNEDDYYHYVDGKPRLDGIKSFLNSRSIKLPISEIRTIGERKNKLYQSLIKNNGFERIEAAEEFVRQVRRCGFKTALVSSSKNACMILHLLGLVDLFDIRIDGHVIDREKIAGKPAPDVFLMAAKQLEVSPSRAVVVEDAQTGIEAAKNGEFGLVVGIAHDQSRAEALSQSGADIVVDSLKQVIIRGTKSRVSVPNAVDFVDHIAVGDIALFLVYEKCLIPDTHDALPEALIQQLEMLSKRCQVGIISRMDMADIRQRIGLEGIVYIASHGFDIVDQYGQRFDPGNGESYLPVLALVYVALRSALKDIDGIRLKQKRFSIIISWPTTLSGKDIAVLEQRLEATLRNHPELTYTRGEDSFHIVPAIRWDEGAAINFIMAHICREQPATTPVIVADNQVGSSIFDAFQYRGHTIFVGDELAVRSEAQYYLPNADAVADFLERVDERITRVAHHEQWELRYSDYAPGKQGVREALCTLANGYMATRGAASEAQIVDGPHYPATYIAGTYNRLRTRRAGKEVENEDLVNFPNWLLFNFRTPNEEWFDLDSVDLQEYEQRLDIKRGILYREIVFCDKKGRITRVLETRIVHIGDKHIAALKIEIEPLNWSGNIDIRSAIDGRVINDNVPGHRGLRRQHLDILDHGAFDDDIVYLHVRTNQSRIEVSQAARTRVFIDDQPVPLERDMISDPLGLVGQQMTVSATANQRIRIEKVVGIYTSRDRAISESRYNACQKAQRVGDFQELLCSHSIGWGHIWRRFDIGLVTSERLPDGQHPTLILRLHIFHLIQTASPLSYDLDVGIPARGWHGEGYRGHVFWDELFVFPLLNLRAPDITRALLLYRYRRLEEARYRAKKAGYKGAMYPWQSGSEGREETPMLHYDANRRLWMTELSWLQAHISADVAYNVWQYYLVTGDIEFLDRYGSEIIIEVARFFASLAVYNQHIDRYEIWNVIGPDEYQTGYPGAEKPGLRNNAYTNIMAVWVMTTALEVLALLPQHRTLELCERLQVMPQEINAWKTISKKMRVVFIGESIISQFEGYESLEEFDWEVYRHRYGDLQKIHDIFYDEGKNLNDYKVSKQADVLMLFYLFSAHELARLFRRLGYKFDENMIAANIDYYRTRTAHGSTLSRIVHSWVLAHTDLSTAWDVFAEALLSDVADIQGGTTSEGIHLGAMAGTVDIVERSFAGIEIRGNTLYFKPKLPIEVDRLNLKIRYRGYILAVDIDRDVLRIISAGSTAPPIQVGFNGEIVEVGPYQTYCFERSVRK